MTRFTIFASSIRKARTTLWGALDEFLPTRRQAGSMRQRRNTYRDRTHVPHRDPPYALLTFFWVLEIVAYSRGRSAGIYSIQRPDSTNSPTIPPIPAPSKQTSNSVPTNKRPIPRAQSASSDTKHDQKRMQSGTGGGEARRTPLSLLPQSPHSGAVASFLMWW